MALQMFACTATQTCVVNISRSVVRRREESSDRRRGRSRGGSIARALESREYRTLSSLRPVLLLFCDLFSFSYFHCLFFFSILIDGEASIASCGTCRSLLVDSIDRSRGRRRTSSMDFLCSLFLNLFFFFFLEN